MPAGCDFICKNPNCKQQNNGFVLTAPWPLGKIEIIISYLSSSNKPKDKEILSKLIEYKNEGEKFSLITFPNINNVEIIGYRICLWSPDKYRVYRYDIELNGKSLEEAIKDSNLPQECPYGKLLTFNEITKEGINCPHCKEKLYQSRWFTNEI